VLFNPDTGETRAMRAKEDSADYRYFPDPDLPPLAIEPEWIERVRSEMPELPRAMAARFVADYALPEYDAAALTQSQATAAYFEEAAKASGQAKQVSNWVMGEVSRRLNANGTDIAQSPVGATQLSALISCIADGTVSTSSAKQVFDLLWQTGMPGMARSAHSANVALIKGTIEQLGLTQMNDTGALDKILDEIIAKNQKNVEEYRAGKEKALNGLVGQVMKASGGKANPAQVTELLKAKLA
jgi:aspartyl-tRNA(Asn)/glutamyl-tRNA(Gln) amidotransferase subunit B